MEITLLSLVVIPIGLGLLGFIEPCTIGGHMLFLHTQNERSGREKIPAVTVFILTRSIVAGLVGAVIAYFGSKLIDAQTGIWLIFGSLYFAIGLAFLFGKAGFIKRRISLSPQAWKQAQNPILLGFAFGLNIPACAAPILFGLLGLAATTGTALTGFTMMFLFGFALSAPLVVFSASPRMASWLERLAAKLQNKRWIIGVIFVLLGLWSIWFGLYVDPINWSGQ